MGVFLKKETLDPCSNDGYFSWYAHVCMCKYMYTHPIIYLRRTELS